MIWKLQSFVQRIRDNMPELPDATRARLLALGLSDRDVTVLMSVDAGREVGYDGVLGSGAVSFLDAVAIGHDPKIAANWYVHSM
jgi:aspartyl-tRNA(Asn)/glutamyl-tRNA(Gln) amidotransferase subunit B